MIGRWADAVADAEVVVVADCGGGGVIVAELCGAAVAPWFAGSITTGRGGVVAVGDFSMGGGDCVDDGVSCGMEIRVQWVECCGGWWASGDHGWDGLGCDAV